MHVDRIALFIAVLAAPSLGCTPSPGHESQTTSTCEHVVDVLRKTDATADEAVLTRVQRDCEDSLAELEKLHRSLTACMLTAASKDEIELCEKPAQRYDSFLRGLGPSAKDICSHAMGLLLLEVGDSATQPSAEDMAKFLTACINDMDREKLNVGAAEFNRRATCIMKARTMEDMVKCKPDD